MAKYFFKNESSMPIHLEISTADVIQYYRNDLLPGSRASAELHDGIWHDVVIIPSNGSNQIDPASHNDKKSWEILVGTVAFAAAGAAIPFTGGASMALLVACGIVTAGGLLTATVDTIVSFTQFAMRPVTVQAVYGPYSYDFTIGGGKVHAHINDAKELVITGYDPLTIDWKNNTTNTGGRVAASS